MRYYVSVNGEQHEVELTEESGHLAVSYDGQAVETRFEEVDRLGQVGLHIADQSYAISIEGDATQAMVTVAGHLYQVFLEDERERAARQAERERGGGGGELRSVMPGVVVELLVSEGETVAKDQPLLILEAMKMQNEIRSDRAGTVQDLHVAAGDTVDKGAKLITVE